MMIEAVILLSEIFTTTWEGEKMESISNLAENSIISSISVTSNSLSGIVFLTTNDKLISNNLVSNN